MSEEGCDRCDARDECNFPFRPLRAGRCIDKDKFWTIERLEKYKADMKDEKRAEIDSQIMPKWANKPSK